MVFALLLVVLEATDESLSTTGEAPVAPPVWRPDPGLNAIDALLKKFEVQSARRARVAQAIVRSSRRHDLDPRLVASILIVESRGNPFAISSADAVGIMQIHVPTWARTIEEEGINLFKIEDNVDFGVRILRDYVKRYGHDEGVKRYCGWKPGDPLSAQNAAGYLEKVHRVYLSAGRS